MAVPPVPAPAAVVPSAEASVKLSVIIPMLNEAAGLARQRDEWQKLQQAGAQVLLVDGGSEDGSAERAQAAGFEVMLADRGRARQMNAGARAASAEVLLFLHADTVLPAQALSLIGAAMQDPAVHWGRFDVDIEGRSRGLAMVAFMMNLRSRLSGIATGDQAIFMRASAFRAIGGFPDQPLMEDIEASRRLKRLSAPSCLRARVRTSGRRWDHRGLWRTILLMWRLRLAYWLGVSPERLARAYR